MIAKYLLLLSSYDICGSPLTLVVYLVSRILFLLRKNNASFSALCQPDAMTIYVYESTGTAIL